MPFAVSNIGFSSYEHEPLLDAVKGLGFDGLEVAPSRVWRDTWKGLSAADVDLYRRMVERSGLSVVGLHSLFFDHPELSIFGSAQVRAEAVKFLVHLSAVCRDLGGKTLIFGSPSARRRADMSMQDALDAAAQVFEQVHEKTTGHGTVFCMEPLGPSETDFCNTIVEIAQLYERIDGDAMQFQIDVRALSANDEMNPAVFNRVKSRLAHVHVNAADLGQLRMDDGVQHKQAGQLLKQINYTGYLSLEQRAVDQMDYLTPIAQSMTLMKEFYA